MNRSKLFFLALLVAAPLFVQAQENVFKINIFSPVVKTLNVQYERAISESGSLQLGFFYTGFSVSETKFSGFGLTPEYRIYLSDTPAPAGVYIAPFVRYQNFNISEESTSSEGTYSSFGGGLIVGKQWIFKERIALDIFIGPSYSAGNVKVTSGSDSFDVGAFDGFGVRTGICLGIGF